MLDIATKYEEKLQELFANISFEEKYKYSSGCTYRDKYEASKSTWQMHEFVSVYNDKILGYLRYSIDREAYKVDSLYIVNFTNPNIIFANDLKQLLIDIFEKFKFRKLSFSCFIGNPIEKSYDKIIAKFGGRIVGIQIEDSKLIDGEYYDLKLYEILREDYLKSKNISMEDKIYVRL